MAKCLHQMGLVWEAYKIGLCLPQLRVRQEFGADAELEADSACLMSRYDHDDNALEEALRDGREWMIGRVAAC